MEVMLSGVGEPFWQYSADWSLTVISGFGHTVTVPSSVNVLPQYSTVAV